MLEERLAIPDGQIVLKQTPPEFPLGLRGQRPVWFLLDQHRANEVRQAEIPGVIVRGAKVECAWDSAFVVSDLLGAGNIIDAAYTKRAQGDLPLPGLARYRELGLDKVLRDYQKLGASFLARRAYAMLCDPPRAGKTLQAIAASVLTASKRTLILCPSLAKYVWAGEIAKWAGDEAVILFGQAGDEVRTYCKTCRLRGYVTREDGTKLKCRDCRARNGQPLGEKLTLIQDTTPEMGTASTNAGVGKHSLWPPTFRCTKHPEVITPSVTSCPVCRDELRKAISDAHWVVTNFDIVAPRAEKDVVGKTIIREDLPGWGRVLSEFQFDVCLIDEIHMARSWKPSKTRGQRTRREHVNALTESVPRVYGLTGTPLYAFTRDLWGQFDTVTRGLWSSSAARSPFSFMNTMCDGHQGEYGYVCDGRTARAETELPRRQRAFLLKRNRIDIAKSQPPKTRQVVRLDVDVPRSHLRGDRNEASMVAGMRETLKKKLPDIVENVMTEVTAGDKCAVFVYAVDSVRVMTEALQKEIDSRERGPRMREVDAQVWSVHGGVSPKAREMMAEKFREHAGAAVMIATIDSMPVSISLKGAATVHFADLHWAPAALAQAENRPYEIGTTGLHIVYYIANKTVDERLEALVMPRLEIADKAMNETDSADLRAVLAPKEESLDEVLARIFSGAPTDGAIDWGDEDD